MSEFESESSSRDRIITDSLDYMVYLAMANNGVPKSLMTVEQFGAYA